MATAAWVGSNSWSYSRDGDLTKEREAVLTAVSKTVHVPFSLEEDGDGVWCAHAWLGSSGGANGSGATRDEAIADLREAVQMILEEDGVPPQLRHCLDLELD